MKVSKKYTVYLILSVILIFIWWVVVNCGLSFPSPRIKIIVWASLIFLFLTVFQIAFRLGRMIDLDVKEFQKIWWGRVLVTLAIAGSVSYIIVHNDPNLIENILLLANTAAFGIVLGYFITRVDERRKVNEEGKDLIMALQLEVSNSRFRCQAIIKGHAPTYFETYIWDSVRLGKHFKLLSKIAELTNQLFNLYMMLAGANWRINNESIAKTNGLINPNSTTIETHRRAHENLVAFLRDELDSKLKTAETALQALYNSL